MKNVTAPLALALTAACTLNATAQEVAGSWKAESINSVEPTEDISLVLAFGQDNTATITYTLGGEPQAWQYSYAVNDGQLTLEAIAPFGEPEPVIYDIKFDDGKLLLLTPKPEPVKEETNTEADPTDAQSETNTDADQAQAEQSETSAQEAEQPAEEDTRTPVWVLVKA